MPARDDKSGNGGGGDGGDDGVAFHVDVHAPVPETVDLCRGEHASAATLVTEGSLSGAVSPAAGDAGDTRDGAPGSPRLGGGLVAGFGGDGVGLAGVVGDLGVDEADDVGTDGGCHDVG